MGLHRLYRSDVRYPCLVHRAGGAADFACQLSVALTAWPMGCATGAGMALPADQREALRILAGSPAGSTESLMLAHGFGIGTLHDLVRNGHATLKRRSCAVGSGSSGSIG